MNADILRKNTMTLAKYRSNGREPAIFRANQPKDLMGVHAELIAKALRPNERLRYLFYSPIRESEIMPFGIDAKVGSHAVAVTEDRFLISSNLHVGGITPTVQNIPFTQVVVIEFGESLLLGWIAIRFLEKEMLSCVSLFFPSPGIHHLEAAIREYRKMNFTRNFNYPLSGNISWPYVWHYTPKPSVDLLRSIVVEEEWPLSAFRSSETWEMDSRRRSKICLVTDGILLVTNRGFIYAQDESPIRPGMLSFGVNVCCIPHESVKSVARIEKKHDSNRLHYLRLGLGRNGVAIRYHVPFDPDWSASVESLIKYLVQNKQNDKEIRVIS